jgi:trans-AT polyketide synthase/acyltransferase/oxidoreductase domain-containing protein
LGYPITTLCLEDPHEQLNQTNYTQPALFVVNALSYLAKNQTPNYVAGHSLGEYNALFAAKSITFEQGLKLVQKRGELMSQVQGGGMAAVIGLSALDIQNILATHALSSVSIANYNAPTQTVITGPRDAIANAQSIFEQHGASHYVILNVSGAFHSPYLADARQKFAEFLAQFTFQAPQIPVIANTTAKPYPRDNIAQYLSDQITHSVRWTETIEYLLAQGETDFQEIGPNTVLTGLIRRIQRNKK